MISLIGNVTFNDDFHSGADRYSDGDVEDELLALVRRRGPSPPPSTWAHLYHLSPQRRNLLEWYPFRTEGRLLEIGAGCGALTGLFCERTGSVTAIELSRRRAEILATRHQEHANLTVYAGSLEDVRLAQTFDVVTLIGVLEYAPRFLAGQDPAGSLLRKAHRLLAPGGRLLLAIENRFGLKYWAGAREDHTGLFFDGLEGYPEGPGRREDSPGHREDSPGQRAYSPGQREYSPGQREYSPGVVTYGRSELDARLVVAGFTERVFYYPMPDYKLPTDIYSDDRLPQPGELAREIPSFDRDRLRLFDEGLVYEGLLQNGLFPEFASSFLVLASKGAGA